MLFNVTAMRMAHGEYTLFTACHFQVSPNTLSACSVILAGELRLGSPALVNRVIGSEALFVDPFTE